jgi:hypothetical protein
VEKTGVAEFSAFEFCVAGFAVFEEEYKPHLLLA